MPRAQETTPIRAGPNRTLPRWSISRRRIHDDQSTRHVLNEEKRLLLANPDLVTCAAPVASLWFGLEKGLESLMRFRNIRKLILPSALQRNLLPVLYQLRSFRNLEDLELRSVDMTLPKWPEMLMSEEDAAMPFCDFSKLKRLVLNDVKVDQSFFIWLAEATNLESLELKDMSYEDELHSLRNLTSLRYLKITGCCENICSVLRFVSCFSRLKDLAIEIGAPDEEDLRLLSICPADIHLKVRRCYHPGQIIALCEIHNLKSLTLSSPFGFKIPRKFKDLKRLTFLGFIDEGDAFNEIEGFENVPTTIRSLLLALNSPNESRLSRVLSRLATQLTRLVLKQKIISNAHGVEHFENLESLKLCGKETLDSDVFETLSRIKTLRDLAIEGCPNVEIGLSSLVRHLDLHSLSIRNGMITGEGIRMISQLQNMRILAFKCCFFSAPDFDILASLSSLNCLKFTYPTGLDQFYDSRIAVLRNLLFFDFQIRKAPQRHSQYSECNDLVVSRGRDCCEF